MPQQDWLPKSVLCLRNYDVRTFTSDLIAGLTVGLVALPLAMAFAISSGLKPEAGIYCAIVAGFVTALLGGTRTQISGPTGAFVVVVYGIVTKYHLNGLYVCTLMAGFMLVVLGITGLGSAVKFIPRPVVVGFTNGIAVLIASTQIKDFLGLSIDKVPGEFWPRMVALGEVIGTTNLSAAALGLTALLVMILMRKFVPAVPGAIVVLFAGTLLSVLFKLPVETIYTRFHGIPQGLPRIQQPHVDVSLMLTLITPASTIAFLGALESLMSAVVADKMTRDKHNPNVELIAQGVANIASPLFGGLPVTGAIARTATNIRSGGKTPVSAFIHALVLLGILVVAAPLANQIPLSLLGSILLMVAYNMGEWGEIPQILRLTPSDISVWAITFGLTVFADLTVAVQAGMIFAALLYIQRVTKTTTVTQVTEQYLRDGREHMLHFREIPDGVAIFRIHGPFLFGSTDKVEEILDRAAELPPIIILRLRNMTAIDATGIQALEDLHRRLTAEGHQVIFCGAREQPANFLTRSGFEKHVGAENVCSCVAEAMERAKQLLPAHSGATT